MIRMQMPSTEQNGWARWLRRQRADPTATVRALSASRTDLLHRAVRARRRGPLRLFPVGRQRHHPWALAVGRDLSVLWLFSRTYVFFRIFCMTFGSGIGSLLSCKTRRRRRVRPGRRDQACGMGWTRVRRRTHRQDDVDLVDGDHDRHGRERPHRHVQVAVGDEQALDHQGLQADELADHILVDVCTPAQPSVRQREGDTRAERGRDTRARAGHAGQGTGATTGKHNENL